MHANCRLGRQMSCKKMSAKLWAVLDSGRTLAARREGHEGLWLICHGIVYNNPRQHKGRLVLDGLVSFFGSVRACTSSVCKPSCCSLHTAGSVMKV